MGSVVGLNENLLEWQIFANESVNPVFVLQHGYFLLVKIKVLQEHLEGLPPVIGRLIRVARLPGSVGRLRCGRHLSLLSIQKAIHDMGIILQYQRKAL